MDKIGLVLSSAFIIVIVLILLVPIPYQWKEIGKKILVEYRTGSFFEPSYAKFDDGTIYLNIRFEGEICIGAKYKIVERLNIYGCSLGYIAIRCS